MASKSCDLCKNTKWISDYMSYEHTLSPETRPDPTDMTAYHYVVHGEDKQSPEIKPPDYKMWFRIDSDSFITVEKVWKCRGGLLSTEGDTARKLKDMCLSFALFKLLIRRFADYPLLESRHQKTHDFVFRGLLSGQGYKRAFDVIELELSFLYDFLYTNYPVLTLTKSLSPAISLASIPFTAWLAKELFKHFMNPNDDLVLIKAHHRNYDALITFIIVVVMALVQVLDAILYLGSNWLKVIMICKYVASTSWHGVTWIEQPIMSFLRFNVGKKYWEHKIGQFMFLDSYDYHPSNLLNKVTSNLVDKKREGEKSGKKIPVPAKVEKAIILALRDSDGRLTNGIASLQANGVHEELSWACRLETVTHTILVWHIATDICENRRPTEREQCSEEDGRRAIATYTCVATSLSKYCAYLVAFKPSLLPGHGYVTQYIFDQAVSEARKLLQDDEPSKSCCYRVFCCCRRKKRRRDKNELMRNLTTEAHEAGIVAMGAQLGRQLTNGIQTESLRWKVLSDFWVEILLYVTPSDNVRAHLEGLANGGELITQLWALLTHAGILDRDHDPLQNV